MPLPTPGTSVDGQYVYNETVNLLGQTLITVVAANSTVTYNGIGNTVSSITADGLNIPVTGGFGATQDATAFSFQNAGVLGLLGSTYLVSNAPIDSLVTVGSASLFPNRGDLTTTQDQYAACYLAGTRLRTPDGEVAVETITIGNLVMTPDGPMPVKWIGQRSYSGRFARGNKTVLPIRISAGALADDVPIRNLWVSPKHALLLDGVLIPAEVLVNGVSIVQERDVNKVEYFHVELERHGVLIAENALAESFVDDNSRGMFHNAHEHAILYPGTRPTPALYCAPRLEDGKQVEVVRRRLALRAAAAAPSVYENFGVLHGNVELVKDGRVYGWAQHAEQPEVPVCLELLLDGIVVAQVLANRYRVDLWHADLGSGCHAFEVALPDMLRTHAHAHGVPALRVRRTVDGAELPNSSFGMPGSPWEHDPKQNRAA